MHRVHYTCRVCHSELGFSLFANTTEITEEDNRQGRFCGACHNDELAFGHSEGNCGKCHNGDIDYGIEKFAELFALPSAAYGNEIDWVEAIDKGVITPQTFLYDKRIPVNSIKKLTIYSEWMWMYAHAQFSHEIHGRWLGCSSCHPAIFNLELKTTEGFSMLNILDKKYCGTCHGKVAFPIKDCKRCHPTMRY
jgi:c(7)-type cytochrome triheme protein